MLPLGLEDSIHIEITVRHRGFGMSRNWVGDYMKERRQVRSEKSDRIDRARMAQAGAGGLFKMLAEQVEKDIKKYHDLGGDAQLRYEKPWDIKFRVFKSIYPAVDLVISLESARILCRYLFRESDADRRTEASTYVRIVSNESGSVQFYKNGEAYSDEAELSEVILKPVFDYIDTAQ
jgi:hypothetical protein